MNVATLAVLFLGMAIGSFALNASVNSNINATFAEMRADNTEIKVDRAEMRANDAEIQALYAEIRTIRAEMQANDAKMQTNDAELRAEMQSVHESLDARLNGIEVEQAQMRGELDVLRSARASDAP